MRQIELKRQFWRHFLVVKPDDLPRQARDSCKENSQSPSLFSREGYFAGSCDQIQWNNTWDSSYWCREGAPGSSCVKQRHADGQPTGDFRFIELEEISKVRS